MPYDKHVGSWDGDEGLGAGEGTLEGYLESYRNRMLAGKVRARVRAAAGRQARGRVRTP